MRKIVIIGLVLVAIVLISGCAGPKQEQVQKKEQPAPIGVPTVTVDIKGFAFEPSTITVPSGTTATWTNRDNAQHTITGNDFDSGSISNGGMFSQMFNKKGTFDYSCTIHPAMQGKVVVT